MREPPFFWRSPAGDGGRVLRRRNDWRVHGRQEAGKDLLDREPLCQRFIGRHHTVTQYVGCDIENVLGQDIRATPHEGEGPSAGDETERCSRTSAPRDEFGKFRKPVCGRFASGEDKANRVIGYGRRNMHSVA